ncbi:uncharacterized protein LOC117393232 [Periophthalmus magnuspinnatus]|uniref:uncharacterized protein LOC117393232 n=1 Tax=Periophthalmus magnuspinnatus TaxID=409849 RepID=UPI00145B33F8|nr:uncharacterized protein LOC117393232 [Periophthalmus magnuspinnatus]
MSPMFVGIGTGWRPAVRHWTRSSFTGKQLRVCIPPESPNKELVLVIGDSHLRSFVERDVDIRADGPYSFGYICSPGATADTLETDVCLSTVDQRVSKCVVLATGNDSSTRGQTVERAQKNFQSLLSTVKRLCPKTCVVDFPARHVVSVTKQNQFRQAYKAAAEAEGLQYVFCVDSFPMKNLRLWAKDGIHLSVPEGMRVLSDLICKAIRELSESTVDSAHSSPKTPAAPCVKPLPKTPDVVVTCPTSRAVRVPSTTPQTDSEGWEFGKKSLQSTATTRNVSLRQVTGLCAIPVSAGRFAVLSAPQKTPATSKNPTTLATKKMKHAARVGEAASSTSSWQPRVVLKKLETTVAEAPVRPAINTAPTEDQQVQTDAVTVTLRPSTCTEPEVAVEVVKPDVKRPRRTSSPVHREADVQEEPDVKRPRRTSSPVQREADMQVPMKKVCCGKQVPVVRLQWPSPEECKAKVAKKDSCHEKQASVQLQPLQHEDSKAPQFDNIVGSFHQGHTIFHPQSRGKQCTAIALAAIVQHTHLREVHEWSQKDLNMTLLEGDRLYIRKKHLIPGDQSYLGAFDFKKEEKLFGKTFCLKMVTVIGRLLSATNPVEKVCFVTLKTALEEHLATDNACLFTMSGSTCAIIAKNGMYAIVDSHARSKSGMVDGNGSSVVVFFTSISEVYDHIIQLAAGFIEPNVEFELNSVAVTLKECDCDGVTVEPTLSCPHGVTELKSNPSSCVTESTAATDTAGLKACDPGFKTKENLPEVGHKCGRAQMKSPLHKKRSRVDTELKSGSPIVKKAKLHDANDITIVGYEENALQFNPLSEKVCKAICKILHVEFENCNVKESLRAGDAGVPCHNEKIVADGNCFFRAISQAISGTQKHHRRIRLNAVKHIEKNPEKYHCLLNEEHQHLTVAEYIKLQKMSYVNTWATQAEIQATADCIGVDIYTFYQGKWLRFQNSGKQQSAEGIYLQNHGAHYEHVVCVKQGQQNDCYKLCTFGEAQGHVTRSAHATTSVFSSNPLDENTIDRSHQNKKIILSKYLRKKKAQKTRDFLIVKYHEEDKYRLKENGRSIGKYKTDLQHKECVKAYSVEKYKNDLEHKEKLKAQTVKKYKTDPEHKEKLKALSVEKYKTDLEHKEKLKAVSVEKYKTDLQHKEKLKAYSCEKYKSDLIHQNKVKAESVRNYKANPDLRQKLKSINKAKYHKDSIFRRKLLDKKRFKRTQEKVLADQMNIVMNEFLKKANDGPEFICCVCFRSMFKAAVVPYKQKNYKNKAAQVTAETCVSDEYLHECTSDCNAPCPLQESRGELWMCKVCHSKIRRGVTPAEWWGNNLQLDSVPLELACLNHLEKHLIALNIPFMKVLALPKGGQNGCHGPIFCIPSSVNHTCSVLPRTNLEGCLLRVKLKRKLSYKGHYEYHFVDTNHLKEALKYLKENNQYYQDIEINEEWVNEFAKEEENEVLNNNSKQTESPDEEDETLHDRQNHCIYQDSCSMPVDLGQETLDQGFEDIINLAPAEGNNPVRILSDKDNEAKSFPYLFPSGNNTYHTPRQYYLTLARYFNNRILHADGRFAKCVEYIFFAQYMSEVQQVIQQVSIASRKGHTNPAGQKDNAPEKIESLQDIIKTDEGYRFLRPIRGTPSFWQGAQKDLLAMVRNLGKPTFFCSFSSADLRWGGLLNSILKQEGRTETSESLEYAERCELLRNRPVTAARMFDYRWHLLLNYVLLSSLNPIGKIKDYFYRVEFQQRGSPHVHALFWIEDAPEIGKNTDEEVVQFIDKYITCEIPTLDHQLAETVTSVQQHSQRHSKTCKKKNTACRFNFPRPVSERTFITKKQKMPKCPKCQGDTATNSQEQNKATVECICSQNEQNFMKEEDAMKILTTVKKALLDKDNPITSIQQLFENVGITQEVWEKALKCVEKRMQIVLQRDVNEIWINPYNPLLLKCWNANMDIQYVVDVYACIVYIISYMSKSEREMGLLLKQTHQEATKQGNSDAKEAMKKIGQAYLHNRDVSAQEAVYRITQMHLKECSRKVVFIPTGDTIFKLTKPLNELKKSGNNDIWMTGFVDRYKNRPQNDTFDNMCIATFASEYRVLSTSEKKSKNAIKLQNSCGYISKRFRTKPAVVRYARFSQTKNPELYYKSLLQLFFPYRHDNDLKPSSFHSFEQFYKEGTVQLGNQTVSVMSIVNSNRSHYDIETEDLEEIKNNLDSNEILEDAWAMLCPEQEAERLEATDELAQTKLDDEEPLTHIPDLGIANKETAHLEKQHNAMTRAEGLDLIRSLNDIQLSIFFKIQKWCIQKVNGNDPEPLHVFITGGAGTGKSHLIRAIQYEANRLFAPMRHHPDNMSVLITAPTGMAAYNLNASTIHSAFSIGTDVTLPYIPLGEEKLNSLRAKYIDLKLVIIDEISMVSHKLLTYIHGRLRQIKQRGDVSPFGNVSLIAVGDFYQLPPVMAKGLYTNNLPVNFWSSFKMAELKTIVRQKDTTFAELLNRLRTRSKGTPMLHEDIHILQSRETGEQSSALHIFPTNSQVNEHNFNQLQATCPDYQTIDAQDYHYNRKTGKMESKVTPHSKDNLTSLQKQLFLGVPARVMLCKNIDVEDGLVNGVCGTVTHISETERNGLPEAVYVQFDDINVGTQRRKKYPSTAPALINSTRIQPEEERANSKGGKRRQFPLALSWAVTIHKVQGLTVDNAVVSLKQVFASGQSYVALSRVRSLDGLIIQDFDEKAIYCNDEVKHALEAMPRFLDDNVSQAKQSADVLTLFLMNVQGLVKHLPDLVSSTLHLQPDCIAVTETWLTSQSALHSVDIDGYSFHSRPRSLAYEHSKHPALTTLKSQHHGGVGMYCSHNTNCHFPDVPQFNLECLIYKNVNHQVLVAVVYRPPTYPMSVFKQNLKNLLTWLQAQSQSIVVMGDFNDDILKSSSLCNFMSSYGYVQNVTSPTTERGTLIDHVYVKSQQYEISSEVVPTYFSDHQGIVCSLKLKSV